MKRSVAEALLVAFVVGFCAVCLFGCADEKLTAGDIVVGGLSTLTVVTLLGLLVFVVIKGDR